MLQNILSIIKSKPIKDINLTGFIYLEDDGIYEFTPMLRFVYVKFGEVYLEFESINQYSRLKITVVPSIRHNFELVEDFFPAISSISDLVFINSTSISNIVSSITLYNLEEYENEITCDSTMIKLRNEQVLFFDPTFISGINIGGTEQYEFWRINNTEEKQEKYIKI
ncbi:hypothetical protein ACFO9Q_04950 [Paenibacillus sp. GCM10023252]|uniref:hypothetical protein n=1 Tax=Paenibacillus sp. GCM10023252 TaxID=3252649 RepID=UPI00360754C3